MEKQKAEAEKLKTVEDIAGGSHPNIQGILQWIEEQKEKQKADEENREKIKALQAQLESMTRDENRHTCHVTGVNMYANLEALQANCVTGVNLAAKAQAAMAAAEAANLKRKLDDEVESEGELIKLQLSVNTKKSRGDQAKRSGLTSKQPSKIRFEVEWVHHWLGKEYEANPIPFNQIKLGHYLMGEADILLRCQKPEEFRARLKLMKRLGYWQVKYDWPCTHNIYAAVMRGIETGRETWGFDLRDYEDILVQPVVAPTRQEDKPRCQRGNIFLCCISMQQLPAGQPT